LFPSATLGVPIIPAIRYLESPWVNPKSLHKEPPK
jgi:hypothetical protein